MTSSVVPIVDYLPDAVVVGSGPNGLAAAIALAQRGRSVLVLEAAPTIGGGCRSAALTLPGFLHDPCSAVQPLAMASPFFRTLPLAEYGLAWIQPPLPLAHPFDDGSAAMLSRSLDETADALGADARAYRELTAPFLADFDALTEQVLGPFRLPRHPFTLARFGLVALRSAVGLAGSRFAETRTRGLFAGLAALRLKDPGRGRHESEALHTETGPVARVPLMTAIRRLTAIRTLGGHRRYHETEIRGLMEASTERPPTEG